MTCGMVWKSFSLMFLFLPFVKEALHDNREANWNMEGHSAKEKTEYDITRVLLIDYAASLIGRRAIF